MTGSDSFDQATVLARRVKILVPMDARPLGILDEHESIVQPSEGADAFETVEVIVGAIPRREEAIVLPTLPQDPEVIPVGRFVYALRDDRFYKRVEPDGWRPAAAKLV